MNIFYLSPNAAEAAKYHCDKHCVKMILESAQLLSTAHRLIDGVEGKKVSAAGRNLKAWILPDERDSTLYTATHVNHPSAVWVRQSDEHYYWLELLLRELYREYTRRYNKIHLVQQKLEDALLFAPDNIPKQGFVEPPQCMPDDCKVPGDAVTAYRKYYINYKNEFAVWKYTQTPDWYKEATQ